MQARSAIGSWIDARAACEPSRPALRLVLVVALDCTTVADCLGLRRGLDATFWPSTLYAWAAEVAAQSPVVWDRCAGALDDALGPWLEPYRDASLATIAQTLTARESAALAGREVAAALWALIRRRDPALTGAVDRLAAEAEILIARTCLQSR